MLANRLLTLSFSKAPAMRYTAKILLVASILAGLTVACAPSTQPALSDPVNGNAVVQASNVLPSQEPIAAAPQTNLPGHNFGDIYGAVDPGASQRSDPPHLVYWVNGQMVVRRSELGPLTDPVSNPVAETVVEPAAVLGPGRDFGAIYGTVDPGSSLTADPVDISVPIHGPGHDFGAIYGDIDPGKK
jgi:hypothetical protein